MIFIYNNKCAPIILNNHFHFHLTVLSSIMNGSFTGRMCGLLDHSDSIYEKRYEKPLEIQERAQRETPNITFDGQIDG